MTKIKMWVRRQFLCRSGLHDPQSFITTAATWWTCRRCGTPLS